MKPFFTLALVLLLICGSTPALLANPPQPHGTPAGSAQPSGKKGRSPLHEGMVVTVIRGIDYQQGVLELETAGGQRLRAQGAPAALKQLRVGKRLLVWVTPEALYLAS